MESGELNRGTINASNLKVCDVVSRIESDEIDWGKTVIIQCKSKRRNTGSLWLFLPWNPPSAVMAAADHKVPQICPLEVYRPPFCRQLRSLWAPILDLLSHHWDPLLSHQCSTFRFRLLSRDLPARKLPGAELVREKPWWSFQPQRGALSVGQNEDWPGRLYSLYTVLWTRCEAVASTAVVSTDTSRGRNCKPTSCCSFSRTSEECSAMKVSLMISDMLSMLLACVQYESWTEANVRPWVWLITVSRLKSNESWAAYSTLKSSQHHMCRVQTVNKVRWEGRCLLQRVY